MDDVLDKNGAGPAATDLPPGFDGPAANPSNQPAMNLLAALKNAPPPMPEGPPTEDQLQRAAQGARRFLWGYLNGDSAVMEAESSIAFGSQVGSLARPPSWPALGAERVKLDAIVIKDQAYDGSKITVDVGSGEACRAKVILTKDIDWEVTGCVVEP